jgi:hypothetical protein
MVTDMAAEQYKPLDLCFSLKRIGGWRSQGAVCVKSVVDGTAALNRGDILVE